MKFWFTTTAEEGKFRENKDFISEMTAQASVGRQSHYEPANSPADADVILYFEPNTLKDRRYARVLSSNLVLREYPNKCFAVDYHDYPIGFMPGIYVGMPRADYDPQRFRAGCYMGQYNTLTTALAEQRWHKPQLLFSFRGSASHEVREQLFKIELSSGDHSITQTYPWFTHTDAEKTAYVEEMLNSKFILCPRGQSTTSIRLFETMELGRVPVILSDDWIAPTGPSWPLFSLHVSESRLKELPDILRKAEPQAAEMGEQARLAWEQWFSPQVRVIRTLGYAEDIMRLRPAQHDEGIFQSQWLSPAFAWKNGWTPAQSLYRNVREGTLADKIKSKVLSRSNAQEATA